jgi:hypothetical protein
MIETYRTSPIERVIMFTEYDRTLNILTLTDADVIADWRNGLLRNTALVVTTQGHAEGIRLGTFGSFAGYVDGSLAEHFYKGMRNPQYIRGTGKCELASVTDLVEDTDERWEFDSFGPGNTYTDDMVSAQVTCEHGVTGRMVFTTSIGELIGTIVNAS